MPKTKKEKEKIVAGLKKKIAQKNFLIFTGYQGLKTKELGKLKNFIRKNGDEYLAAKKTLLNLALKQNNLPNLNDLKIEKEVGLVFTEENKLETIKSLFNFAKEYEKFEIKAGLLGQEILNFHQLKEMSLIPSLEILKIKLLHSLQTPMINLLNVLKGNLNNLVYVLKQIRRN